MTAKEALQFAVDFSEGRTAGKQALAKLRVFLRLEWGYVMPDPVLLAGEVSRLTDEELARFREEARTILRGLVDVRDQAAGRRKSTPVPTVFVGPVGYSVLVVPRTRPPHVYLSSRGGLRNLFLDQLLRLLAIGSIDRLRRCPESKCGHQLFYKVGRREYCSDRCRSRTNGRRFYDQHYKAPGKRTSLQRIATRSQTGGRKLPQLPVGPDKNARHSPGRNRRA